MRTGTVPVCIIVCYFHYLETDEPGTCCNARVLKGERPIPNPSMMKMSQLSEESGLSISTIKYYISQGLLPHAEKKKPNVSRYDERFLEQLLLIKKMRDEGISISSIRTILDKHSFDFESDWEEFKESARSKDWHSLDEEERLATISGEQRRTDTILDAAVQTFSSKGYHNTTVDDIAQCAGVSKGTCYQYFEGKEDLFLETLHRTLQNILTEADAAAVGQDNPLDRLLYKGTTFVERFKEFQLITFGLYTEMLGGSARIRDKSRELLDKAAEYIAVEIREGYDQGLFREIDPLHTGYMIMGMVQSAGNLAITNPSSDSSAFFKDILRLLRRGIIVRTTPRGDAPQNDA